MKNKHKKQIDDVHNLIRGAIGSFKSTAFSKNKIKGFQNDDWRREQRALLQINKALDKAKAIVSPEEFQDLNKWVHTNLSGVLKGIDQLGCKLTSLGLFPVDINSKGLPVELSVIADRIELKFDSLSRFSDELLVLESKFIHEQWQVIKDKINSLVEQHGYSYWALEELIAAEEKLHGLEAMKTYVSTLNKSSTGANKFILYQIGVRNEPAQAAIRFKDSLRKRIDSSNIKTGLKPYFKFRLFGDIPSDEKSLAEVLAAEQLTTDIDLFFTSIKIALFIDSNKSFFSQRTLDANCKLLEKINPLISRMGMNTAGPDSQAKLLLTDEYDLNDISTKLVDISNLAAISIKALLCSDFKNKVLYEVPITTRNIISGILSQLSTISDGVDSDLTHQILLNHNCYPIVMRLGDFSHLKQLPRYLINIINQKNISNSYEVAHPLTQEISKLISEIVKSDLHSIEYYCLKVPPKIAGVVPPITIQTSHLKLSFQPVQKG